MDKKTITIDQVEFDIKSLSSSEYTEVCSMCRKEDGQIVISKSLSEKLLKYGLVGWSGAKTEFSPANIAKLPMDYLKQLVNEIMAISALAENERKNSF